jgi:hypothetical protein
MLDQLVKEGKLTSCMYPLYNEMHEIHIKTKEVRSHEQVKMIEMIFWILLGPK